MLEEIKSQIRENNIKCVSFDIFDTLLVRPLYKPSDLFFLLNDTFKKATHIKSGTDFTKIRMFSEVLARENIRGKQDTTIDEIYEAMSQHYHINIKKLNAVKKEEIELEKRFLKRRETGYELYKYAIEAKKDVIITSDMYLTKDIVEDILKKNGYEEHTKLYLSSDIGLTKNTGHLFKHIIDDKEYNPNEILHIGDNLYADVESPRKYGIRAIHLPKTIEAMTNADKTNNLAGMFVKNPPFWSDTTVGINFIGIRTMLAMCANKYFDNPFRAFDKKTNFNADPYLIGYYAMGMYLFGITKWLLEDMQGKNYDKIVFMARDGYLPMESYKLMKKYYTNAPKEDYVYVSRKALIPVTILTKLDFYKLPEIINITKNTPKDIVKYLDSCLKMDYDKFERIMADNEIQINEPIGNINNYNKFIKLVIDYFYDEFKHKRKLRKLRRYFEKIYENNSATFDIGYSARPEYILSKLLEKNIDTYFLNINTDEALIHADMAGFTLKTFFNCKPAATGFGYESMISKLAPSCIGYDINGSKVEPIFEEYNKTKQEEELISTMQNAALEFVKDMVDTFGENIKKLYCQNYYASLPMMAYIHSASEKDKSIFDNIYFEDDVRAKQKINMNAEWKKELKRQNQKTINDLFK